MVAVYKSQTAVVSRDRKITKEMRVHVCTRGCVLRVGVYVYALGCSVSCVLVCLVGLPISVVRKGQDDTITCIISSISRFQENFVYQSNREEVSKTRRHRARLLGCCFCQCST